MKIIVERSGVPTAKIHVEIISNHPQKLGEHRPVTFVLPGGPGASHELYLKYSCLKPVTDVVFHDPRGCGQSDKDHLTACTMDNYIDDVEAIRKHLSLDKVIILGKSYGSMCALGYALRYQPAVEKLILATGAPSYHFLEKAKKIFCA